MTGEEIRAAIAADPALQALVPNTAALAIALSEGRKKFVPTDIGNGTIIEVLGLTTGNALLDVLNTDPSYKYIKPLLEQGRLRLDSTIVRGSLSALVGTLLTAEQEAALVGLAKADDPVSEFDVRIAIIADDGTLRV